jgi:hypothetical protein
MYTSRKTTSKLKADTHEERKTDKIESNRRKKQQQEERQTDREASRLSRKTNKRNAGRQEDKGVGKEEGWKRGAGSRPRGRDGQCYTYRKEDRLGRLTGRLLIDRKIPGR